MRVVAEIIGILILLVGAYYGGVALVYRWMNGPKKRRKDDGA